MERIRELDQLNKNNPNKNILKLSNELKNKLA